MQNDMRNDIKEILLSEERLNEIVTEIGARISRDYDGKSCFL